MPQTPDGGYILDDQFPDRYAPIAKSAADAETEKINENKKEWGNKVHLFRAAEWTHPNGHPRCLRCGDEEPEDGLCMPDLIKYARMLDKAFSGRIETITMSKWVAQFHSKCIEKSEACSVEWPVCPVEKGGPGSGPRPGQPHPHGVPGIAAQHGFKPLRRTNQGQISTDVYEHPETGEQIRHTTGRIPYGPRQGGQYDTWEHMIPVAGKPKGNYTYGGTGEGENELHTHMGSPIAKYITSSNGKFTVHAESGRVLGTHGSHAEAAAQLRAIEANKHRKAVEWPVTPNTPGYGKPPIEGEKAPNQVAMKALQEAFMAFAKAAGIIVKREEVLCEQVELAEDGTVYKIEYGDSRAFFSVQKDGMVEHLGQYYQSALIPIVKAEEQRYTLGAVYAPGEVDFHGDTMSAEEIEKAAWSFAKKDGLTHRVGLMHTSGTEGAGEVVESYVWRSPKWEFKDVSGRDQTIAPGAWMLGVVWTPEAWKKIKSGAVTGLSLQGVARKWQKGVEV
jgi:hypothetical protein